MSMNAARILAYVALCGGIILVERALLSRAPLREWRPLAALTDQLMIFSTILSLGGGLIGTIVFQPPLIEPAGIVFVGGLMAGAGGLWLRATAMRTLGGDYTLTPRSDPQQRLVSTGAYSWIRHPGYAGILLSILGLQMILGSWLAVVCFAFVVAAVPIRIRVEEEMLLERFGAEYAAYRIRTRHRLVPGLF
jgi:protein-S-isoprenylcysteine O-methyltransferase Ste14